MTNVSWTIAAAFLAAALPDIGLAHGEHHAGTPRDGTAEARNQPAAPAASAANERWRAGHFPNVPLLTHEGRTVRFYDDLLKGKRVVINVIYTECTDECPLMSARLAQVQKLLGESVGKAIFFHSISIDPERDTPAVLKAYREKFGAGPGWLFLTGNKEDITRVQKKLGLWSRTDAYDPDGHLASLMIGNEPNGQWMRQSAVDDPRFLATKISTFLAGWKNQRDVPRESYAQARPIEGLDAGSYLFRTRCAACHTIGNGDAVGPDLLGVTSIRERSWLARYIKTPDKVLAEKDPVATVLFAKYRGVRMPNLGLGDGDVQALIRYLEAQTAASRQAQLKDPAVR
ncbi:MAG: SCO family protein [Betaproteobacteria bacterium]|nr:SCO family protein [Betaproteobacteria bacterium]MBI2960005.1 SCO family protein [Betaproteobacteria bacterium]